MGKAWRLAVCALLVGCKPPAFLSHETDLLRSPPPILPEEAHGYWNDLSAGTYGEMIVGPGLYPYRGTTCRAARVTAINTVTRAVQDQALLYCAAPDGRFFLDPSVLCRAAQEGAVTCRTPEGDNVTLRPAS